MYWVRLECPKESTNRSRPGHFGSTGSCRSTRWYRRYAAGARLIAVPGCPEPTFWTASMARTRTRSTARLSEADQSRELVLTVIPSAVVNCMSSADGCGQGDPPDGCGAICSLLARAYPCWIGGLRRGGDRSRKVHYVPV